MYNFDELKNILPSLENDGIYKNLPHILRGMEKEGLRQTRDGQLAQTEHPKSLGSALTNKYITTDYSEALIEFITPVFKETEELQSFLTNIHSFARKNLPKGESFWCHSMPCILTAEEDIPIANYGSSNIGKMKHIYRHGLAWRYTRRMQTIAGMHFNFSYPEEFWKFLHKRENSSLSLKDFKSVRYFDLIRNFKRHVWLLFYFTGSSPALCKSFLSGQKHTLQSFDDCTAYMPHATSLRMSDLGYTNNEQQQLKVSFNSIEEYTNSLSKAIDTPSEEFQKIGIKVDGKYRQLNDNILQIENEFYNIIRPKRTTKSGEKPTSALRDRGVEYLEIRMLDINPFEKTGISSEQIHLLDTFMLSCLLSPSPSIDKEEDKKIKANQEKAILEGRDPKLEIEYFDSKESFKELAKSCLDNLALTAKLLDKNFTTTAYSESIINAQKALEDPSKTPSGKILEEMKKGTCSYYPFARNISAQHNNTFLNHKVPKAQLKHFQDEAVESISRQKEIENSDSISFDEFLSDYFSRK
ncbi:MAG: glutamate--cysteine ligase [Lentisphaeraceae bacterium]|nr:glutamate--cysteine ligase [Lentisphaeraceae bacterium]